MITSTANPKVKWVRALQLKRKAREEERLFVVEGIRLAREAVAAGVPARLVIHTETLDARGRGLANSLARLGAEVELVSESVMAACSDTDTPPGLLAVVERPDLPFPLPGGGLPAGPPPRSPACMPGSPRRPKAESRTTPWIGAPPPP